MTRTNRTRLSLEALDERLNPSITFGAPSAFNGLTVAVTQFQPSDPCQVISPVFAFNFGEATPDTVPAMTQLEGVLEHLQPSDPCRTHSPVLFGLSNGPGGGGGIDG